MNEQQLAAANAPNGYIQIIAGPGTGKTFTLVHRIVELLRRGLEPSRIVVVTFTRAAAREVLERVNKAMNTKAKIIIGTFHSVALRLLRRYGGETYRSLSLIDEQEKADILRGIDCVPGMDVRKIANQISVIKSQRDNAALSDALMSEIYESYERRLRLLNKTDFDGLLCLFLEFLQNTNSIQNAIDAVLVDEFQDTSLLQLDIAMLMAERSGNMTVVGDPDQSIYGFRNADMRNFVRMAERHNTLKWYLEKNYRSEQAILTAATRVIQESQERYTGDRQLLAAKEDADVEVQFVQLMSPQEEAQAIVASIRFLLDCGLKRSEICVLSRYTSKFQYLETAMLSGGIPSKMVGGKRLSERKEVRLIIDYMRVVLDGNNALAVERTINNPRRGLGEKTLSRARNSDGILTLRSIRAMGTDQSRSYTRIIDDLRKLLVPLPTADVIASTEQALSIVRALSSTLFGNETSQNESELSSLVEFIQGALEQFQVIYEDTLEDEDRSFLEAFLDQWALGTDAKDSGCGDEGDDDQGRVTLSTIHSAKGLEWPVVFMIDVSEESGPMVTKKDSDEDRRLLYVAMTRAKSLLVVSSANAAGGFDKLLNVPRSMVTHEIRTPDINSLSACVGRVLQMKVMAQRRSVLGKSKRFDAKAPVELPPGFLLASELPQAPSKPPQRSASQVKPLSASSFGQRPVKDSKKVTKTSGKTLLSFWSASSKN